ACRQIVAQQRLDILHYTDIGMGERSYTLAATRLAPIQCVTWGHPMTTGLPSVDYFISSEDLDAPDAQDHYTEKLVRLGHMAVFYMRPARPVQLKPRDAFGCPAYP